MGKAYGLVADQVRDAAGKGSVLKRGGHEGPHRRPVETVAGAKGLDDWKPVTQKKPEDFRREVREKERTGESKE